MTILLRTALILLASILSWFVCYFVAHLLRDIDPSRVASDFNVITGPLFVAFCWPAIDFFGRKLETTLNHPES